MTKKLTITVSDDVYEGLHQKVGRRRISGLIDTLAREHLRTPSLDEEYAAAAREEARDEAAGREAREWIEAAVDDGLDDEGFDDVPGRPAR